MDKDMKALECIMIKIHFMLFLLIITMVFIFLINNIITSVIYMGYIGDRIFKKNVFSCKNTLRYLFQHVEL